LDASQYRSLVTGNWRTAANWQLSVDGGLTWIPAPNWPGQVVSNDTVLIRNNHTITLNGSIPNSLGKLTVGEGISGTLQIGNNNKARTFSILGNLEIAINGSVVVNINSNITHTLSIAGDIINNGTLDFRPDANSLCDVTFNRNGNQNITGNGITTRFNLITLNMGTSNTNVLEVSSTDFQVPVPFLILQNGTFKYSSTLSITPFTTDITAAPYLIPNTAGLWVNGGTVYILSDATTAGLIRVSGGVLNLGDAVDERLRSLGATVIIEGGTFNIAGRLSRPTITDNIYFTMSGGTLVVGVVGNTSPTYPPFNMDQPGATFTMSGGTIIIRREGGTGPENLGYMNLAGTANVTGGTIQIGDGSTPVNQTIGINTTVPIFNLVVNNIGNPVALLQNNPINILNDLNNSSTLDANNLDISIGGNWFNNGTFIPGTATVLFNGSLRQSISGASATSFNNLTLDNSSGLSILTSPIVNGVLNLVNGIIETGINNIYISSSGSVNRTNGHVFGNLRKYITTGATVKNFEVGDAANYTPVTVSFGNVTSAGDLTISSTGSDHPDIANSGVNPSKSVNRYWTLTNSGVVFTNYNVNFNFVSSDIDIGANPNTFIVSRYSGGTWSQPTVGTRTPTSTEATGLTDFGDFQIGEQLTSTIKTWDGGAGTTNWGDALNWNPDGVPTSIHDIQLNGAYTIDVNVVAACNSILLNNSGLILNVRLGSSLNVSTDLNISNGTLNVEDAFPTVGGSIIITGGTIGYTGAGDQIIKILPYNNLSLSGGGVKTAEGNLSISGDFINSAVTSIGIFTLSINGNKTNTGTIQFSGGNNGVVFSDGTIEYNGSVVQTVTAGTYYNLLFSNSGQKNINSNITALGNLTINANANVTLGVGQVLQINGEFNNYGIIENNGTINLGN